MKKFAIGCGVVLLVALVVAAAGTYYAVSKVKSTVAEFAEFGKIGQIEREVRNTGSFAPPESGELSDQQVARYVRVQAQIRQTLGVRFKELDQKYKALSERINKNQQGAMDLPELVSAYRDLASLFIEAKRAQVAALNAAQFSLSEYRWVRTQAYAALDMPLVNMDLAKIIEDAKAGKPTEQPGTVQVPTGGAPEKNRTLLAPYKKLLEDNVALSFFGL
jgi:hypothetical protein